MNELVHDGVALEHEEQLLHSQRNMLEFRDTRLEDGRKGEAGLRHDFQGVEGDVEEKEVFEAVVVWKLQIRFPGQNDGDRRTVEV